MFWKKKRKKDHKEYQSYVLVTKYPIPGEEYNFLQEEWGGGFRSLGCLYKLGYTLDYILQAPYNDKGNDKYYFADKTIPFGMPVYYYYLKREKLE